MKKELKLSEKTLLQFEKMKEIRGGLNELSYTLADCNCVPKTPLDAICTNVPKPKEV